MRGNRWFEVRPSPIQGSGGFATRAIAAGTRIVEYTGERIGHAEADARYDDATMPRHHTFLMVVDDETVIDAAVGGGPAKFINHSCEPNCRQEIVDGRAFIVATRAIAPGEELTYDYAYTREAGADEDHPGRYACRCGAPRCRGTILSVRHAKPGRRRRSNRPA